jgi:hypothetical protein
MIGGEWKTDGRGSAKSSSSSVQGCFALPLASFRESYRCVSSVLLTFSDGLVRPFFVGRAADHPTGLLLPDIDAQDRHN